MMSIVEQIKERVDIVELVSQYVQLKKRGSNYFGLCPFHSEKTPSFSVNPKGQFFHCFGCGESGDVITFFMKIENLDFHEAVRELAERYNIPIDLKADSKSDRLIQIHETATEYFHKKLFNNRSALDYLKSRNIADKTIEHFKIGYAPQSGELLQLLKRSFSTEELLLSGIFVRGRTGLYNRFSERIIFPIRNTKGKTIAFGGRILNDKHAQKAKYINSPETPIFSKQRTLFGLYEAQTAAKESGSVIVTEGYMDCIRLHESGIENAVATLGTALTTYHMARIKRYADRIYFNYDADEAGFRAMARSARTILSAGVSSYVVTLPGGEDPDSFVSSFGAEEYLKLLESAKEYFDYLIEYLERKYDLTKPQDKLKAIEEIKPVLLGIKDATIRSLYISKAATALGVSEQALIERKPVVGEFFKNITTQEALLSFLLKKIELMMWIEDHEHFSRYLSEPYRSIFLELYSSFLSGEKFDGVSFAEKLPDDQKRVAYELLALQQTEIERTSQSRNIFLGLINRLEREHIEKRLKQIKAKLKQDPANEELLNEYNELFLKLKEML